MTETFEAPLDPPRRFQFDWIMGLLFSPRRFFEKIAAQSGNLWLTPMLTLTLTTILRVVAAGWLSAQAAASGMTPLPLDFQYYTPEQQAQYLETMQATQGPVFTYILPALAALLGLWIGWLFIGGLLHLTLTLLGGRGTTGSIMHVVAWASLAYAARDVVRLLYMLVTHKLIVSPGLSGFSPLEATDANLFLTRLLMLVDLFLVWYLALIVIGVRAGNGLGRGKAVGGVLFTVILALLLQAALGFVVGKVGDLTVTRPFFF